MRIFIMGAGHMGAWLAEKLCLEHDVAVYDIDGRKLESLPDVKTFPELSEVASFAPELVINAVSLHNTQKAFAHVLPFLPEACIISDIASVKTGLKELYEGLGKRFVSTHPMFGPTFADIKNLRDQNAIVIKESDEEGKAFFRDFYGNLHLHLYEYTFEEHDRTIAYSLSVPFASSMVFAACLKNQEAPGTTFRKHLEIARGLFSEDDALLSEIMFNPHSLGQIEKINSRLVYLTHIIRARDYDEMHKFLDRMRKNIE
jgi:prephenate dehydrogenase